MKTIFLFRLPLLALAVMALMVTGCPYNDYTVELKPQGSTIDRTLVFYRADGGRTNNGEFVPGYQAFDAKELATITGYYPTNSLTQSGLLYTIHASFGSRLPSDVGGAGSYTNWSTTLGDTGFYVERFRGNDDIATLAESRFKASDQLTDLLLGWSRVELGHEPGYSKLRQFLDQDFRRDLKNASCYLWEGQLTDNYQTNAGEEFMVRFGQYLYERGYFSLDEIPSLNRAFSGSDSTVTLKWLQRLVARRMGVLDSAPIPSALNFLGDEKTVEQSFTNYVAHTDLYCARLKEWKREKESDPNAKEPTPDDVVGDCVGQWLAVDFHLFGDTPDHLTVKLTLPSPPLHTNGKWDAGAGQVVWSSDVGVKVDTNRLSYSCFASWAQPVQQFQQAHFGKIILTGDDLIQYCLWRRDQDDKHGGEWDAFLAGLQPDTNLLANVSSFRFSDETETNSQISSTGGRDLLRQALK